MFKLIYVVCIAVLVYSTHNFAQNNDNGVLLYSQISASAFGSVMSDYYWTGHSYNCQTADDFNAGGNWSINQIIVAGSYSDTYVLADNFNIYFYSNNNDKPDTLIYFAVDQPYFVSGDLFTISLSSPVELVAGHYWISVQANLNWNSYPYEVWIWHVIADSIEDEALFKNPSGVLGTTYWSRISNRNTALGTDMYFELNGSILTSVESEADNPANFVLSQNYPNPFNPSTKISWQSPVSSWQTLKIYDVLGNEVATLVNEEKPAGSYEIEFNASKLSSGTYFYQLRAGSFLETKKMILMK